MENPKFSQDPEYEYDDYDYDDYEQPVTRVGLPPGQLALIIGVNAVISLIIAIAVFLIAGRPGGSGPIFSQAESESESQTTAVPGQTGPATPAATLDQAAGAAQSTPIEQINYTVEPGDTLSLIATKFSVSVYDLMVTNGLTDQDFIQAGQSLVIPVGGVPSPTPTFTPIPRPTETPLPFDPPTPIPTNAQIPPEPAITVGPSPTPTPTPVISPTPVPTLTPAPADQIEVVINEIISPGDLARETVVILNRGAGTSLKDWTLEGSPLGIFQFPDIFLFSGGSIRVHTTAGENTASDLYLGQGGPAWPPGVTIILNDNRHLEISRLTAPAN
jgi:LysM repeat protein